MGTWQMKRVRSARGFSIVETIIAGALLTFGVLGITSLQVVGVRSKNLSSNMMLASSLGRDLVEQVKRWEYNDSRLTMLKTVTSTTDSSITALWDMGRATTVASTQKAQFGEGASDPNATTSSALGASYLGVQAPEGFYRYWNVYGLDIAGTGVAQGKLVQVIVRWKEPGLGMRQVAFSTFVYDTTAVWQ